jgi:hypothetical protein
MRHREVSMRVSTRSFSLTLVLVVMASLFLAATAADAQSQFATVSFQGHITAVHRGYVGISLPASVMVGDTITGFFVYDLSKSSPSMSFVNPPSIFYEAMVCAGFSTDGITVTVRTTEILPSDFVEIRNDDTYLGASHDEFHMRLSEERTKSILPLLGGGRDQIDVIDLAVFTSSSDPNVNPSVLTSGLMQVMPAVGWDTLDFHWEGVGDYNAYNADIEAQHGQPFQISVVAGAPPPCALPHASNAVARRDFDGDQKAEIAVFRPDSGNWYFRASSYGYPSVGVGYSNVFQWGLAGDVPIAGDFDGDGKADLAVWRPSNGTWYLLYSSTYGTTFSEIQWGLSGDVPVAGDFDGDGKTDLAVWRPSSGVWYIRYSSLGYDPVSVGHFQWGLAGDVPIAGDFDGDGKTDLAIWRPSNGSWYIRYSLVENSVSATGLYQWGVSGDIPLGGDFDGDGKTDLVIFRPSDGSWYIRLSSSGYSTNSAAYYQWGLPGDQPLALDFDGDGASDLVVYRPDTGEWYMLFSSLNFSAANYGHTQWGLPGDVIPR